MKTQTPLLMAISSVLLFTSASCQDDWGQKDPPAGGQVVPTLEEISAYDFEAEEGLDSKWVLHSNSGGADPAIVDDASEIKGGKVLQLDRGYVSLSNPYTSVKLQEAASMTFWLYQPVAVSEEASDETPTQDISSTIIGFENENSTGHLRINANGGISYNAADGEWSDNDPASVTTGYMPAGEWHYVALDIHNKGYKLYVDGHQKVNKTVTDFDCSKLVKFINNVPTMTIGGSDNASLWVIDDLKLYRNEIADKQIARPNIGGGNDEPVIDFSKWVLVGNEDNSTPFWSTWAPYVNLTGDGTIHYDFYNFHGGKTDNWCNWGLVITNGPERGAEGYAEYLYLRADAYGWGSAYNGDNIKHDFDWATFMKEMDGAYVNMDITRSGADVNIVVKVTAEDGTVRNYSMSITGVDCETMGTFLTCEGSHLYINPETVFVGKNYNGNYKLGAEDFSTGWWSEHSPLNRFDGPFTNWGVEFVNHTAGNGNNWNNWLLVCTNGTWIGEEGYAENFVLRSDAYGWGATYDGANVVASFDWDNYVADMKDCKVKILFNYKGGKLHMLCKQVTADGRQMPDYQFTSAVEAPIGLFFTVELAWLDFSRIGYYPWATVE